MSVSLTTLPIYDEYLNAYRSKNNSNSSGKTASAACATPRMTPANSKIYTMQSSGKTALHRSI